MFTMDFTDPGLKPLVKNVPNWDAVDHELTWQGKVGSYTQVTIRNADGLNLSLWRPLGHANWLPAAARPWFRDYYPDAV
jgi:hypothetical protein